MRPILRPLVPAMLESLIGVAVVAALGALLVWLWRSRGIDIGGLVCVLAAIEALFLVIPFWHRADGFYPSSTTIDTLAELQGSDRVDGVGVQMTGTANHYRAATTTGHTSARRALRGDLLRAADPNVFTTATYSAEDRHRRDV